VLQLSDNALRLLHPTTFLVCTCICVHWVVVVTLCTCVNEHSLYSTLPPPYQSMPMLRKLDLRRNQFASIESIMPVRVARVVRMRARVNDVSLCCVHAHDVYDCRH
jgi:hypothetical protein